MLFLKLVIAAALAVTVSASPLQKDSINTDNTVLQRRAAVVEVFGKRSGQSACGFCNSVECQTPNSQCPALGCCN